MSSAWRIAGIALVACATCGGCALVAGGIAGAAGHAYLEGAQTRTVQQPVRVTAQSVVVALHRMGIHPKQSKIDDFGGTIQAETADGDNLKVRIDPEGDHSVVSVRVGMFGDEKKTEAFFARLDESLPNGGLSRAEAVMPAAHVPLPETSPGVTILPGESSFEPDAAIPSLPQ